MARDTLGELPQAKSISRYLTSSVLASSSSSFSLSSSPPPPFPSSLFPSSPSSAFLSSPPPPSCHAMYRNVCNAMCGRRSRSRVTRPTGRARRRSRPTTTRRLRSTARPQRGATRAATRSAAVHRVVTAVTRSGCTMRPTPRCAKSPSSLQVGGNLFHRIHTGAAEN